jgi:hypothetical protein
VPDGPSTPPDREQKRLMDLFREGMIAPGFNLAAASG